VLCIRHALLQVIPGLPRPLVKICDFGYSKHDNRSVARSKVVSSIGNFITRVHQTVCCKAAQPGNRPVVRQPGREAVLWPGQRQAC